MSLINWNAHLWHVDVLNVGNSSYLAVHVEMVTRTVQDSREEELSGLA
jgi:hypothetical protein